MRAHGEVKRPDDTSQGPWTPDALSSSSFSSLIFGQSCVEEERPSGVWPTLQMRRVGGDDGTLISHTKTATSQAPPSDSTQREVGGSG